jgi:hypothetical protein
MKLTWKDKTHPNFGIMRTTMYALYVDDGKPQPMLITGMRPINKPKGFLTKYHPQYGQQGCVWHWSNGRDGAWLKADTDDEAKAAAEVIWRMQQ